MGFTPKLPFVRSPYNYDMAAASHESGLICEDCSLTVQEQAVDADINLIVKRFGITGQLPSNVNVPLPEDFYEVSDFHTAMAVIRDGQEAFDRMPAGVRARFENDPHQFLEFVHDETNVEECIRLGIAVRKPASADAPKASDKGGDGASSSERSVAS